MASAWLDVHLHVVALCRGELKEPLSFAEGDIIVCISVDDVDASLGEVGEVLWGVAVRPCSLEGSLRSCGAAIAVEAAPPRARSKRSEEAGVMTPNMPSPMPTH